VAVAVAVAGPVVIGAAVAGMAPQTTSRRA